MDIKKALELRRAKRAKQRRFLRQDAHKRPKLKKAWRKPRGYQSKMRMRRRGYARARSQGFGAPRIIEGLTRSGQRPVVVATIAALDALDVKRDCAILAGSLGGRRREQLLLRAKERKIAILNARDIDAAVSSMRTALAKRKQTHEEARKGKEKKAAEKKTIEERAAPAAEPAAEPDEAKKAEEAEKQKVLTKRM
jgi:large subunit ribosomal protein L32e